MRKLIEEIDDLHGLDGVSNAVAGRVSKLTNPTPVKNALSGTWLGHPLHPALASLPIGAWAMATVLDVTAGRAGARAARRLVGVGLVTAVPTALTGASDWSDTYGPTQRVGLVHGVGNAAGTLLQATSWLARRGGCRRFGAALSLLGIGVTATAAYLGAHLSYVRGVGVNHTAFEEAVSDWTDVAAVSDLHDDQPLRVMAGGVPVMLVRRQGKLYALSATCTHAGGPLDEGTVTDDGCIRCPWHGSVFRLADGEVVRGPASVEEPRWDVKIDDGRVHVRYVTE